MVFKNEAPNFVLFFCRFRPWLCFPARNSCHSCETSLLLCKQHLGLNLFYKKADFIMHPGGDHDDDDGMEMYGERSPVPNVDIDYDKAKTYLQRPSAFTGDNL